MTAAAAGERTVAEVLPGMPERRPRLAVDEVRYVLDLRAQLTGIDVHAVDVEPLELGYVAVPVDLFAALVAARLTLEELVR